MAAPTARRLILLLAALTALVLTAAAGVALTPAAHAAGAQNRVGAFIPGTQSLTRPAALESSCTRPGLIAPAAGMTAGFCVATEEGAGGLPPIAGGSLSIGDKIAGQMAARGWTQQSIDDTILNPSETHDVWDLTGGSREAATAYVNSDGAYVVVNDSTDQVVQISDANDAGWKPVWNDPRFQR